MGIGHVFLNPGAFDEGKEALGERVCFGIKWGKFLENRGSVCKPIFGLHGR